MDSKNKVFINHGKGPIMLKDAKGAKVRIQIGETVELDEAGVKAYCKVEGLVDLSKVVKPAGDDSAALRKENAELKAKVKDLEAKLEKSEKEKEDLLA